jgi:N4-gp56 family major capsid protein
MALTTVQTNNKLIVFRKEVYHEYIRQNLFSPYIGNELTAIIRVINDLKKGGEQINIPLIARLKNQPIATGTLVGNEEQIDNYGDRAWLDWARNAVVVPRSEEQKSSIDLFGQARPLLEDWGKELQRDEIIDAFYAVPLASTAPAGLGTNNGQRVNGALFDAASAAQRNTWTADNTDRVLFGGATGNFNATWATAAANVTSAMTMSAAAASKMKRLAKKANPRIRPYKLKNGREYFVVFVGSNCFRDLQNDTTIITANTQARAREGDGLDKNPLFQDGDLIYNGMIFREIPEMDVRLPTTYTTAGSGGIQIAPVFLCGQGAMAWIWGRMPLPTFRREDDYQFIRGVGVMMAYGMKKIAKLNPAGNYKEWGIFTGYFASATDS